MLLGSYARVGLKTKSPHPTCSSDATINGLDLNHLNIWTTMQKTVWQTRAVEENNCILRLNAEKIVDPWCGATPVEAAYMKFEQSYGDRVNIFPRCDLDRIKSSDYQDKPKDQCSPLKESINLAADSRR